MNALAKKKYREINLNELIKFILFEIDNVGIHLPFYRCRNAVDDLVNNIPFDFT